ncbi:uncharacterized protein F4822DRAFT_390725 [Hypoxylon trugodes]|uniref:uncharacterized protein n=1 Tax=Hypoxylon trugodes TaxID=326681 RepID=UPI002196BD90|nr:uncharacterized protein F4822DRAFT_390725 [Hypoxylon trugodes]KAI1392356.1 hypothetical protein F4822DRAFT_390725 [Hypoxylon trugodes]
MQLTSLFAAAGLAAFTTNAFLLPPDVSDVGDHPLSILPVPVPAPETLPIYAGTTSSLMVKCPGCPVRIPHHKEAKIVHDIPSHLELNFHVKTGSGEEADSLTLNGFEIYPNPEFTRGGLVAGVHADIPRRQMKKFPWAKGPMPVTVQKLGFGMQTSRVTEESTELISIELDVIEVGDAFVDGIPNVQVKLLKTPENKLMIADVKVVESEAKQNNPMDKQEECATMICKWKAVMMQKLAAFRAHKGCGGRPRPAHVESNETGQSDEQVKDQDKPQDFQGKPLWNPYWDGERGEHHGHRHRNWGLLFKNIGSHILLPVAIGILAGVFASM